MRHIVLHAAARCPGCQLRPRWCICAGRQEVALHLDVDLLVHFREQHRPSSTGNLIKRVVPAARQHVWRRERKMTVADLQRPGREVWILHPRGEPVPADAVPANVQILLLDGSWREAAVMADEISTWGRTISLPAIGESRYWLRHQADGRRYSTMEALMVLVQAFGLSDAYEKLRRQFELHVYASLRARGQKELATKYLEESPVPDAFPELLARLNERRTNEPA